jgi:hypothetical protein
MQNPIDFLPMFQTPANPDDLMDILESVSLTRAGIVQAACMAINLCHELVENEINLGKSLGEHKLDTQALLRVLKWAEACEQTGRMNWKDYDLVSTIAVQANNPIMAEEYARLGLKVQPKH